MGDLSDLEKRVKRIEEQLGIVYEYPYAFEEIVGWLDHRTMEMIWSGEDSQRIAITLIGLSQEKLKNIKATFSKSRWNEIIRELGDLVTGEVSASNVKASRETILDKILKLERMGEIVVARGDEPTSTGVPWKREKEPSLDVKSWLADTFEKI